MRVKYVRKIKQLDSRLLRAMLHKAWIDGNDSMEIHSQEAGTQAKHDFINKLLVEHGLATPKTTCALCDDTGLRETSCGVKVGCPNFCEVQTSE